MRLKIGAIAAIVAVAALALHAQVKEREIPDWIRLPARQVRPGETVILPDGQTVTREENDMGVWVRYDGPGGRQQIGRVDVNGQRFGIWHERTIRGEAQSYWYFGREVETADELEKLVAEQKPRLKN